LDLDGLPLGEPLEPLTGERPQALHLFLKDEQLAIAGYTPGKGAAHVGSVLCRP
jgi:hypothetical protein